MRTRSLALSSLGLLALIATGLTACAGTDPGPGPDAPDAPVVDVPASADIGDVIARVNGMPIGSEEFAQAAARETPANGTEFTLEERLEILDRLVNDKVLYQEALRQGLDQDPKVQKVMVNTLLRQEVYANVRNSDFGDAELQAYYDSHKDEFIVPEKVQIKHILIRVTDDRPDAEAKQMAEDVRGRVAADPAGTFKDVAMDFSEDPYRRRGGDVGFVSAEGKAGLDQSIVDRAFGMKVGELSQVFKTENGYSILYVANRRERVERTFDQMKGSVLRKVKNDALKAKYDAYVEGLKASAVVDRDQDAVMAVEVKASRRPSLPGMLPPDMGGGEAPDLPGGEMELPQ